MASPVLAFANVSFSYDRANLPLFDGLTATCPTGWTGIVGANGTGKTTLLALAAESLKPDRGSILSPGAAVICPQRTDEPPERFEEFLASEEGEAIRVRARLALGTDWAERWDSLSHGERKRAQVAFALWRRPAVLAVDEPTNHLDATAAAMLRSALAAFEGVGLLVSHDRSLLDGLCKQCLFLGEGPPRLRPGGYSAGREQARLERLSAARVYELARSERRRVEREAQLRKEEADRMRKRRSKRGIAPKDHDAKGRKDLARVTGKDGTGGRLRRQILGRLLRVREREAAARVGRETELGIWIPCAFSMRDWVARIGAGSVPLGASRRLEHPALAVGPRDRIALTGPNGCGKSTLVRALLEAVNLPAEKVLYIPQELEAEQCLALLDEARRLERKTLGKALTVVNSLGSEPARLLESELPSPGETRKLKLALGIAREPHLVVLDEPTNHLDLPSIECLQEALAGCPCALLLVSHDETFLRDLSKHPVNPVGRSGA